MMWLEKTWPPKPENVCIGDHPMKQDNANIIAGNSVYLSKFYQKIERENRAGKKFPYKTMGSPVTDINPKNFLRKGGGCKPERPKITHKCHKPNLPRVPPRSTMSLNTMRLYEDAKKKTQEKGRSIYFPLENIRKVSSSETKYSNPRVTKSRNSKELRPVYVLNRNFGKVPNYINEMKRGSNENIAVKPDGDKANNCKVVENAERYELLKDLKENWIETYKEFQNLSIVSNTGHVVRRKNDLDQRLNVLERDIKMLEEHPLIYVRND